MMMELSVCPFFKAATASIAVNERYHNMVT